MTWLRSRASRLSVLALFALALQFGLSFGHVHHEGLFAAYAVSQTEASSSDTSHDADVHRDVCAICITVAMAQSIVDAVSPLLPLPDSFAASRPPIAASFDIFEPRRLLFQIRAPPFA